MISTRKHFSKYTHLNLQVRSTFWRLQLKSVQTTAEVCTDYTCSLHRLRRGFENRKLSLCFCLVNQRNFNVWNETLVSIIDKSPSGALLIEGEAQLLYSVCCPQGKRINIQANYECLQARHSFIAQGEMRAKPEMKPWVNMDTKNKSSVGAALSARAFAFVWSSAPLKGLNQYIDYYSPGLAPWAMQECRPYRAH